MSREIKYFLFLLALIVYAMFVTGGFGFNILYSAYTDNFNMYYLSAYRDLSLFPGDAAVELVKRYMNDLTIREFFFCTFYRVLLSVMPLAAAVKAAALLLASLSAYLVYRTGRILYGDPARAFFLATAFLVCFLSMDSFYYGQNRSFGAFFFVLLAYALSAKRYLIIPPLIYVFYVFYPYLALSAGLVSLALLPKLGSEGGRRIKYLLLLLAAVALSAMTDIHLDTAMDQASAWAFKFSDGAGGALSPFNPLHMLLYFALNINEHSRLYPLVILLFSGTAAAVYFSRGREAFLALRAKGLEPLLLFFLSFAVLYPINPVYASRQIVFALPFALALLFSESAPFCFPEFRPARLAAALALLFAAGHPFLNDIEDFSPYSGLYSHVSGLPKGALIAAAPDSPAAAGLPFFAGRRVFYSKAMANMFSMTHPDMDRAAAVGGLMRALCSKDPEAPARFAAENGIGYYLVESVSYGPKGACGAQSSALYEAAMSAPDVYRTSACGADIFLVGTSALGGAGKARR